MRLAIRLLFMIGVTNALRATCYLSKTSKNPYEFLGRSIVETKRGCEVLCDADSKCAGFAFKDLGFNSSCVLLKNRTKENQICAAEATMFLKTLNCDDRTNLTEEFGEDPCIDKRVDDAFRGLDQYPPCIQDRNLQYFVRAIDSNGIRITLDNENLATITKVEDGGMFAYYWKWEGNTFIRYIVAATCVQAGAEKCPCPPLNHITNIGYEPNYPATPDVVGPCKYSGAWRQPWLYYDQYKWPQYAPIYFEQDQSDTALVKCKAGLHMLWRETDNNMWAVNGLSCYH